MNVKIALLGLLMMLSGDAHCQQQKEVIWLFGDSLSAPSYSWAEQIDDAGNAQIMNTARNGLRMVDVDMPDWLVCSAGSDKVIIWLGGNDALGDIPDAAVSQQFRDMMHFLTGRGCDIYVILPPDGNGASWPDWEAKLNAKRVVIFGDLWGKFPNVTLIDMPWDWGQTLDGLHQNEYQHSVQAAHMITALGLD
jgi:lysophospholipase L1-like esterase